MDNYAVDTMVNQYLTLHLLSEMGRFERQHEIIKVMKGLFGASLTMIHNCVRAFSLHFYVWKHGAFSKDVYRLLESLEQAGLATRELEVASSLFGAYFIGRKVDSWGITEKGQAVLNELQELETLHPNSDIVQITRDSARTYAPLNPAEVRAYNHGLIILDRQTGQNLPLDKLPQGRDIILRNEPVNPVAEFCLPDGWAETLSMVMDGDYDPMSMRQASTKSYDELFAGL